MLQTDKKAGLLCKQFIILYVLYRQLNREAAFTALCRLSLCRRIVCTWARGCWEGESNGGCFLYTLSTTHGPEEGFGVPVSLTWERLLPLV